MCGHLSWAWAWRAEQILIRYFCCIFPNNDKLNFLLKTQDEALVEVAMTWPGFHSFLQQNFLLRQIIFSEVLGTKTNIHLYPNLPLKGFMW